MRCRFELDVVKRGGGLRTNRLTGGLLRAQFGEADTKIGWKSSSRLPLRSTLNEETPLEFLKVSMCQLCVGLFRRPVSERLLASVGVTLLLCTLLQIGGLVSE